MRAFRVTLSLGTISALAVAAACSAHNSGGGPSNDAGFSDSNVNFDVQNGGDGQPTTDSPSDAAPPPPSAGGTGAFGVITINGKQKMYLPQRVPSTTLTDDAGNPDYVLAVVDVGVAGNGVAGAPALMKQIPLGSMAYATTTGGDTSMVVAASTDFNDIWFVDPQTDTLVKHINLDSTYGTSSFSGGGGYVTGIAADATTNTAYLSVWNGFAVVDLGTQAITKVIQTPPSENFGFDSVHGYILAPFYQCTGATNANEDGATPSTCGVPMGPEGGVMSAGLSIIDLKDDTVYTYEDPTATDPLNPLGNNPDSASADPISQAYIVPDEFSNENVLDFSKATFDKASKTVTAPHVIVQGFSYEGVAVEPNSHLAFFENEGTSSIALFKIPQAVSGDQGFVSATMPNEPVDDAGNGGGAFTTVLDPHGIAVSTSILSSKPVGFLVDNQYRWVARVDLTQLAALEEGDASVLAGTTQIQAAVTYLDANTPE